MWIMMIEITIIIVMIIAIVCVRVCVCFYVCVCVFSMFLCVFVFLVYHRHSSAPYSPCFLPFFSSSHLSSLLSAFLLPLMKLPLFPVYCSLLHSSLPPSLPPSLHLLEGHKDRDTRHSLSPTLVKNEGGGGGGGGRGRGRGGGGGDKSLNDEEMRVEEEE